MIARRLLRRLLPQKLALGLRREWLARHVAAGKGPRFEDDIPLLKTFVKPTDVCWDIGANAGTYTLHLSRVAAQVFAFEPVPHNFDILRDVTRHAGLTNVVSRSLALSDTVGRAKMAVPMLREPKTWSSTERGHCSSGAIQSGCWKPFGTTS